MAFITKHTFTFGDDKCLVLANEEWTRQLPNLANWSRIRIGVLCAVTPNGTSNITDCPFFIGLSSGKSAPASALLTTNYFGVSVTGGAAPLAARGITYTANNNLPYFACATGQVFRKYGSVVLASNFNTAVANLAVANSGNLKRKTPIIIDISRQFGAGGAYTVNVYSVSTTTVAFDFRPDHLLDALDQTGTPTVFGQTLSLLATNVAVNASELWGALDTLSVYWGRLAFSMELYAVGAVVIQDMPYPATTIGGALDPLENYSTGSIASATILNSGTGWSGTYYFTGTSQASAQSGYTGTSCGLPYDTFDTYTVGTASSGFASTGSGWAGVGIVNGTSQASPQSGYTGTSCGLPYDTFDTYTAGTASSGIVSTGSGWAGVGIVNGTTNLASGSGFAYAGTTYGFPYDSFEAYSVTTQIVGVIVNSGSGWATFGTLFGTANPSNGTGYAGTAFGFPYDPFESYAVGAVTSNVTVSAGSGWAGNGIIYP